MSCEKYSGWMTDGALGELRAEHESDLLAHAAKCAACREALTRARAVREFVDHGVESLVAKEPSPQFAMRLRQRIAAESVPLRIPWTAWGPVMAGALALAVAVAILVTRWPVHNATNPSATSAAALGSMPSAAITASAPNSQDAKRTAHSRDSGRPVWVRPAALPEILVPEDQLVATAQLSAAIGSGRVDGNQLLDSQRENEKPLEVKRIEIAPMETPPLDDVTKQAANSIQF